MKLLRPSLAAVCALTFLCLAGAAEASGRARAGPTIAARAGWGGGGGVVAEAARWVGSGNFTGRDPGLWCADAVNAWLRAAGKPPLRGRMAQDALAYGPRGSGSPGELIVFLDRRGRAYHVGIVTADLGDRVEMISGNWGNRVARSIVSRRGVVFVAV